MLFRQLEIKNRMGIITKRLKGTTWMALMIGVPAF
jgi:hypothetical protein